MKMMTRSILIARSLCLPCKIEGDNYPICSDNTVLIRFWKGIGTVRRNLFWLSDEQWKRIEPYLPTDVRGVERADDRRVISGIVHVLKSGCRWGDCAPPEYGPPTTIYNRFVRRGSARRLGKSVPRAYWEWTIVEHADDRRYAHQGPPLGRRR